MAVPSGVVDSGMKGTRRRARSVGKVAGKSALRELFSKGKSRCGHRKWILMDGSSSCRRTIECPLGNSYRLAGVSAKCTATAHGMTVPEGYPRCLSSLHRGTICTKFSAR